MYRLIVLTLFAGCAHDIDVVYPGETIGETGTVCVVLSNAVAGVTIAVNGRLVVSDVRTQRVVISGVTSGYAKVAVAAGALDREFEVWVPPGEEVTVPLAAIEAPQSRTWISTLISVAAAFVYVALF